MLQAGRIDDRAGLWYGVPSPMGKPKHTYTVEVLSDSLGWVTIVSGEPKAFCQGYVWRMRDGSSPRLAARIKRSDGAIVDELQASSEVGTGMHVGCPTAEQYQAAGERAIETARKIREREARKQGHR